MFRCTRCAQPFYARRDLERHIIDDHAPDANRGPALDAMVRRRKGARPLGRIISIQLRNNTVTVKLLTGGVENFAWDDVREMAL